MDKQRFHKKQIQQNIREFSLIRGKKRMKDDTPEDKERLEDILYQLDEMPGSLIAEVVVTALLSGSTLIERPNPLNYLKEPEKTSHKGRVISKGLRR